MSIKSEEDFDGTTYYRVETQFGDEVCVWRETIKAVDPPIGISVNGKTVHLTNTEARQVIRTLNRCLPVKLPTQP